MKSRLGYNLLNLVNLRTLILLLGTLLTIENWHPLQPWLEIQLFNFGTALMEPAPATLKIGIVELNRKEHDQLSRGAFTASLDDPTDAEQFPQEQAQEDAQILPRLNRLFNISAPMGILLPSALQWHDNGTVALVRQLLPNATLPENLNNRLQLFLQQRQALYQHLNSEAVTLGVEISDCRGQHTPIIARQQLNPSHRPDRLPDSMDDYFSTLPFWLQPTPPQLNLTSGLEPQDQPVLTPSATCQRLSRPLLWRLSFQEEAQLSADFVLALYQRFSNGAPMQWQRQGKLTIGGVDLPLAADSGFIPVINRNADTSIHHYRLSQYQQAQSSQILLVGAAGDPALTDAATALQALHHKSYMYTPAAAYWLQKLLLIALTGYLFFILPKASITVGTLLSCLLITALLVAQLGWQITQWVWLPLYEPMGFLIGGHMLMLLWLLQRRRQQGLIDSNHTAHYQLGLHLYQDSRSEDALKTLTDVATSPQLLELLYDIGAQQERKRLYDEALQTYRVIQNRERGYRDVAEKISKMEMLQSDSSHGLNGNLLSTNRLNTNIALAKTLVLTDAKVNNPVLGRYEIEQEIGRGAMGVVYLGRDPKIARRVAIKTLNYAQFDHKQLPEVKERFFREAEAAGRLSHPSIVTVYDVGEERDMAFIAMDYLEGTPLSEFIQTSSLLPVPDIYKITAQVAEALHFAHSKHIVHRDVKPANIIYNSRSGQVTVTDFGIARITDHSRTRTGDIMGSPLYMSPEQLRGNKVTQSADIFSLGVTLYQLLTGRLPFEADNLAKLTYQIIHSNHKSVREWRADLPLSAPRIVNKALQKSPEKRFTTANDMSIAMKKSLQKDFGSIVGN